MGEVCMVPPDLRCCLGQRMVLLRPNRERAVPRYLLYALQSKVVQDEIAVNEGTGSAVSNLRIPLIESLPIPTPPLPEQRAIAHILGTLDDKIELNRRMNETLEAMARALSKAWFVDFEPVRAKAEGRDTGLAREIAELIQLATQMREANARGEALGLTEDELAFYDALETNASAVKILGDDTLRLIARELVETVRNNVTIDWTLRENVRAQLRVLVKRILKRHGYPPDKQEQATQTVLEQAAMLSSEWAVA